MPNIVEITDLSAPELDVYARLTQAQLRNRLEPDKGIFIAESPKVITRALDAGYTPLSLLMERKQITGPAAVILTRCGDAPVYTADRETLASLTGFVLTRGVLCALRRPLPRSVEEVCRNARRVAVLEGIVDSTNVGAIFRSAAALNMDAVLVTPSCCDPLCRRAVRVSMGTVFQVPWAQIGTCPADWPENGIAQLHSLGFKTAAMALSDRSVSIDDSALSAEPKLAIVLGTEGDGLAHSTIAACDYTVKIPMSHGVDSLNVAAASAVAFWQLGNPDEPGFWPCPKYLTNRPNRVTLTGSSHGPIAQLGERSVRIREVKGSNPSRSTFSSSVILTLLLFFCIYISHALALGPRGIRTARPCRRQGKQSAQWAVASCAGPDQ